MKRLFLILILGAVQVLNTTFAQGTPWKLPVFTNITDLAAKGSPLAFDKVVLVTDMNGSSWYFATNTVSGSNTTTRIASALVTGYSWQLVATAGGSPGGGNVFSTGTPNVGAIPSYVGGDDTNVVPSSVTIGSTTNGSGLNMQDTGMGYFGLRAPDTVTTNSMLIGFVYPPPNGSILGVIVDGTNVYLTNITVSAGTTINPTDGYQPYRMSSSTFGDSPWNFIQADAMGFGSTNWAFVLNTTNTLIGERSYTATSSAIADTAFGQRSLTALTSGHDNTAVGDNALAAITTSSQATAVGSHAGVVATSGNGTFLGYSAGASSTTANGITMIGEAAGQSAVTADNFTAIGTQAGIFNLASDATVLGYQAGVIASNLTRAVIIGSQPLNAAERHDKDFTDTIHIGYKSSSQTNNTQVITNSIYIGPNLLPAAKNVIVIGNSSQSTLTIGNVVRTPSSVSFAAGQGASGTSSADGVAAFGYHALAANTSGFWNTAVGSESLAANTSGLADTAVGYQALKAEDGGASNVAIGSQTLIAATSGDGNTGVGASALGGVTTGEYNIGIGEESGFNNLSAVNVITGSRNIHIGYLTGASATNVNEEITIGYASIGKGTHTANIGNSSVNVLYLGGSVAWAFGTGVPALSLPNGSLFSRTDGTGPNLYVRENGAWAAK